jgi:tetratricopeptide (TPR) repeat protein
VGIYWDNSQALDFLARLRSLGPGGVSATAPIYERVAELEPKNVRVLNMLGVMRINAGRVQEAEEYLRRAVGLAPDFADAHYNLGLCLMKESKAAEAVPLFRRAVEIKPAYRDARIYLAIALHNTGSTQEAMANLHYVLNMNPKDETAISLLAKMEGRGEARSEQPGATAKPESTVAP